MNRFVLILTLACSFLTGVVAQAEPLVRQVDDLGSVHFCKPSDGSGSYQPCPCCRCVLAKFHGWTDNSGVMEETGTGDTNTFPRNRLFVSDDGLSWYCRGSIQPENSQGFPMDTFSPCGILSPEG